jgi:NADH-quinone oxidoreductase subunit L
MTFPLIVLAILAVAAGFVFIPEANPWLGTWLSPEFKEEHVNWLVMILSTIAGLGGIFVGWAVFSKGWIPRDLITARAPWLYNLLNRKYYIDELYQVSIITPLRRLGLLINWFDHYIVDGIVRLSAAFTLSLSAWGTKLQNGQLQSFGLMTLLGFVILLLALIGRRFIHVG